MECNREEAERCAETALRHLNDGNYEAALRLLSQSHRLFPSEKIQEVIQKVQALMDAKKAGTAKPSPAPSPSRTGSSTPFASPEPSPTLRTHTKEQLDVVRKITRSKNYYEVLEISRECTEADIKKAYRRLAVLVHPDKNPAPGAEEAFKRVAEAFAFLSDSGKREKYDRYGHEEALRRERTGGAPRYGANMEAASPEELFNMFFNMPHTSSYYYIPRRNTRFRHPPGGGGGPFPSGMGPGFPPGAQQAEQRQPQPLLSVLLQLLPILLLMFFAIAGSPFSSRQSQDPLFSFEPEGAFQNLRVTSKGRVEYYVADDFAEKTSDSGGGTSVEGVEDYAEKIWVKHLQNQCSMQRQQRQLKIDQAKYRWTGPDQEALAKAQAIKTTACDDFHKLRSRLATSA